MDPANVFLKRYTNLASALDIVSNRRLCLLDPAKWDDKDDAYFIRHYQDQVGCANVRALCFTMSPETYHHWRIYSHGNDGVCFEFDRTALVTAAQIQIPGIDCREVDYRSIQELEASRPAVEDWPFIKRLPYAGEGEFRMVKRCSASESDPPVIDIDISCISRIKLSPWLHPALVPAVQNALRNIAGRQELVVYQSKLIDYSRWRNAVGVVSSSEPAAAT